MITVLTPTFNRAHTLPRLFESLQAQTKKAFEWLVIDDGSTDNTRQLINEFVAVGNVKIRYLYQNNSGKHVAINAGVKEAIGTWLLILDSDDALTTDAIETASKAIEELIEINPTGICFRKANFDQTIIGATPAEVTSQFMHPTVAGRFFKGDLAYIFRTAVLRDHLFPVYRGEKFVPELYVWNQIGDQGLIWFDPKKAIYLCEYLPDGYTVNFKKNLKKNPKGFGLFYRDQFIREISWITKIKCFIRAIQCSYYSFIYKKS